MATVRESFSYDAAADSDIAHALGQCDERLKSAFIRQSIRVNITRPTRRDMLDAIQRLERQMQALARQMEQLSRTLETGATVAPKETASDEADWFDDMMSAYDNE